MISAPADDDGGDDEDDRIVSIYLPPRARSQRADHQVRDPVLERRRSQQEEVEGDHREEDRLRQP